MCADGSNHRIRRIDLGDSLVSTYVGPGQDGVRNGARLESSLSYAYSVCAHPLKPNCYFIGDMNSVRYCNGETVSLIAGGPDGGRYRYADGLSAVSIVFGLLCTSDGRSLYFTDGAHHRLRCVDLKTQTVTTVCGNGMLPARPNGVGLKASLGLPQHLCFDRSPSTKPESVIFITSPHGIRRFDIDTGLCLSGRPLPAPRSPLSTAPCPAAGCFVLCDQDVVWCGVYVLL